MDPYVVYCVLGMAESEDRKIFLWPQWKLCFELLDPIFRPFAKTSVIKSLQAYAIPLKAQKNDPPGIRRLTFKKVPVGKLRWNVEDNQTWSQRPLEPSEYPIRFIDTRILTSNSKTQPPEIQISVFNRDTSPGSVYNQIFVLMISEPQFRTHKTEYWDGLVHQLASVAHSVQIAKTSRPWWLERPRGNYTEGSSLADEDFTKRFDSLELNDSWQKWQYLT